MLTEAFFNIVLEVSSFYACYKMCNPHIYGREYKRFLAFGFEDF